MPYTYGQHEVRIGAALDLTSTGDKANWAPGRWPHYIRAVAIVAKAAGSAAGVVKFDKQPTAGSASGRGDGDVAVLTAPNPHAQGKVLAKENLRVLINPGEQVVAEVTTAWTGVNVADIILMIEPVREIYDNMTGVTESA